MPLAHLLTGPNGSGKTTFYERVLGPATGLAFINADVIARQHWPGEESLHAYEAARLAAQLRDEAIARGSSFVAETVFSHPSKLDLVRRLREAGFLVVVHVMLGPLALTLRRVEARVKHGGHDVPLDKQHERFPRVWPLVADALRLAHEGVAYDNTSARHPFRIVARFENGQPLGSPQWPAWADLGRLLNDAR